MNKGVIRVLLSIKLASPELDKCELLVVLLVV